MYYRELRKIINVMQGFCDIWDLPAPVERNKVEYLIGEVSTALKFKLPDDYVEFLKEYDGLEFDGYIIYGTDNFLENQADYECISKQYLIFAEYDIDWFCMRKSDRSGNWINRLDGRCSNSYVPEI